MGDVAFRRGPSISRRELCRLVLQWRTYVRQGSLEEVVSGGGWVDVVVEHTEGNAWVLSTDVLTLLIGKEHVGRQTTLWGIWVYADKSSLAKKVHDRGNRVQFLLRTTKLQPIIQFMHTMQSKRRLHEAKMGMLFAVMRSLVEMRKPSLKTALVDSKGG